MELYRVNDQLERTLLVEGYEALIWTERYFLPGDFVVEFPYHPDIRTWMLVGDRFMLEGSEMIMILESAEHEENAEESILRYKGRTIDALLDTRMLGQNTIFKDSFVIPAGTWSINIIIDNMINHTIGGPYTWPIGVPPEVPWRDIDDELPFSKASSTPSGTITFASPTETHITRGPIGEAVREFMRPYGWGFKTFKNTNPTFPPLIFRAFRGLDRSLNQTTRSAVIFSQDFETLSDGRSVVSIEDYKNVAFVVYHGGKRTTIVLPVGVTTQPTGYDRRVLFVDANSVDATKLGEEQALAQATQIARSALAQHRNVSLADGTFDENGVYELGVHFDLGDIVSVLGPDGTAENMRVTEIILAIDSEGERIYPTLEQWDGA